MMESIHRNNNENQWAVLEIQKSNEYWMVDVYPDDVKQPPYQVFNFSIFPYIGLSTAIDSTKGVYYIITTANTDVNIVIEIQYFPLAMPQSLTHMTYPCEDVNVYFFATFYDRNSATLRGMLYRFKGFQNSLTYFEISVHGGTCKFLAVPIPFYLEASYVPVFAYNSNTAVLYTFYNTTLYNYDITNNLVTSSQPKVTNIFSLASSESF